MPHFLLPAAPSPLTCSVPGPAQGGHHPLPVGTAGGEEELGVRYLGGGRGDWDGKGHELVPRRTSLGVSRGSRAAGSQGELSSPLLYALGAVHFPHCLVQIPQETTSLLGNPSQKAQTHCPPPPPAPLGHLLSPVPAPRPLHPTQTSSSATSQRVPLLWGHLWGQGAQGRAARDGDARQTLGQEAEGCSPP